LVFVDANLRAVAQLERTDLTLDTGSFVAVKDPCPVRLDGAWHLFGTAVHEGYRYEILHAISPSLSGPWRLLPPAVVPEVPGNCVAAPGVVAEEGRLHMFLQTDYNLFDGRIEHLVSEDAGATFHHEGTALASVPGSAEAGIYDAHPCEVAGERFLVYSAFSIPGRPDIALAHSPSGRWAGPWERLGPLLRHEEVPGHNQHDDPAYEWGLEAAQLFELPDGRVLLNVVGFQSGAPPGDRQRIFFAHAERARGPFLILGSVLEPPGGSGEVGHGCVVLDRDRLALFFQERAVGGAWRYGLATVPPPRALILPSARKAQRC
jgi:hypothetical protein